MQTKNANTEAPKGEPAANATPTTEAPTPNAQALIDVYAQLTQGEALIDSVPDGALRTSFVGTLAQLFESACQMLAGYGTAFERIASATVQARKGEPNGNGERTADAFRIVPLVKPGTLAAIVFTGAIPTACPTYHAEKLCRCVPVGGITIDHERSTAATEAGKAELVNLPIPCIVLVTPGLSPEAKLTARSGRVGTGGNGAGKSGGLRGSAAMNAVCAKLTELDGQLGQVVTWKVSGSDKRVTATFTPTAEGFALVDSQGVHHADPSTWCDVEKRRVSGNNPDPKSKGRWSYNGWREISYIHRDECEAARRALGDNAS